MIDQHSSTETINYGDELCEEIQVRKSWYSKLGRNGRVHENG